MGRLASNNMALSLILALTGIAYSSANLLEILHDGSEASAQYTFETNSLVPPPLQILLKLPSLDFGITDTPVEGLVWVWCEDENKCQNNIPLRVMYEPSRSLVQIYVIPAAIPAGQKCAVPFSDFSKHISYLASATEATTEQIFTSEWGWSPPQSPVVAVWPMDFSVAPAPAPGPGAYMAAPAPAPGAYYLCSGPGKWNPSSGPVNWFHLPVLLLLPGGPDTQEVPKLGFSFSPHVLFANHPTQIREFEIVVPTEIWLGSGYNAVLDMTCRHENGDSATFSTLAMSTDKHVLRITFRPTSNPWLLATADGFAPQCVIKFDRLAWWIFGGSYIMTASKLVTRSIRNRANANTVMRTSTCTQDKILQRRCTGLAPPCRDWK